MNNFVFNGNNDNKWNAYLNCYSNIENNAVVCIDKKNITIKGNPKIVVRTGDKSKFGGEMIFQFLIKEKLNEYPTPVDNNVLEYIYFIRRFVEYYSLIYLYNAPLAF